MILYKTFKKSDSSDDIERVILLADMLRELRFASKLDQYRFKVKIRYIDASSILEAWITGTKDTVDEVEAVKAADKALKDLFESLERRYYIAKSRVSGTDISYVAQGSFDHGQHRGRYGKTHKRGR